MTRGKAWAVLGVVVAGAAALLVVAGDGAIIRGDEWNYTRRLNADGFFGGIFEPPPGKYSLPIPLAWYWLTFETLGVDSYWPYRLAAIIGLAAIAFLLLELLAKRIGYDAALPLAAVTMVLGSAAEVTAISVRFPAMVALAFGLAAMIALDRESDRGDIMAGLLLLLCVASHPLGMGFVAAAGIIFLFRADRWRKLPLAVVPGVVGLAIIAIAPSKENSDGLIERGIEAIAFIPESLTAATASITGTFEVPLGADNPFLSPLAWALAAAFVAFLAYRLWKRELPLAQTLAVTVLLLIMLAAPALAPGKDRNPAADRYLHPNAVILLVLVGIAATQVDWRSGRGRYLAGAGIVIFGFSAVVNTLELERAASRYAASSTNARAQLTAFEVAGKEADPALLLVEPQNAAIVGFHSMRLRPPSYRDVAADYDTPAFTLAELAEQREFVKQTADKTLALAYSIPHAREGEPTELPSAGGGFADAPQFCARGGSQALLEPGDSVIVSVPEGSGALLLGRFARSPSYSLGTLAAGTARLELPADEAEQAWVLATDAEGAIEVCEPAQPAQGPEPAGSLNQGRNDG